MTAIQSVQAVQLLHASGYMIPATLDCTVRHWAEGGFSRRVCIIRLTCAATVADGEGDDLFDALCRVREQLEQRSLRPRCYGASLNVFRSGMCRDMSDGAVAYKLRLGHHTRSEDMIGISDDGPDVEPATVQMQEEFWRAWLNSSRS